MDGNLRWMPLYLKQRKRANEHYFHGRFYGLRNFCCKTAQFCTTPRESEMAEAPGVSNAAQACENEGKTPFLN
jgi:hypothetical protein